MTTGKVMIPFGNFSLLDPSVDQIPDAAWPNGLVAVQPPGLLNVVTATRDAEVQITLEALTGDPGHPDPKWEAVAEVSITTSGTLEIFTGDVVEEIQLIDLPAGPVRVRVHARNRVLPTYTAEGAIRPDEEFLLQVWSAPEAPETVLRQDSFGRNFQ